SRSGLDFGDVAGLRAFGTVYDLEFDRLAFFERAEAVALNRRVVHEDVTASVALDEPITLGVVEPLDLACDAHRSSSCLTGPRHHVAPAICRSRSAGGTKKDRKLLRP